KRSLYAFQHLLADDHVATRRKRHRGSAEVERRILEGLIFPPGSRIPMRLAAYLDSSERVRIEVPEKSLHLPVHDDPCPMTARPCEGRIREAEHATRTRPT